MYLLTVVTRSGWSYTYKAIWDDIKDMIVSDAKNGAQGVFEYWIEYLGLEG